MTETSPCSFQNFTDDSDERVESTMGFIQDHVEVSIMSNAIFIHNMTQIQDLGGGSIINNYNYFIKPYSERRFSYINYYKLPAVIYIQSLQ